ncbi:MAG TPA: DoxX family protein [Eudoraea sp.]|nr:DoxX family protein [Eudoraea sp.]
METNISRINRAANDKLNEWVPLLLRIPLAIVVFPHGAQKLFGWFGGYGFDGTMKYFTDIVGMPWIVGLLVILMETVGAFLLAGGLATRIMALSYTLLGFGIMSTSLLKNGFFMNWYGNQEGEGIEYFILWFGISIALFISGGGKYSLDSAFKNGKSS